MSDTIVALRPRAERQQSGNLGLYLRAGFNSQRDILDALAAGHKEFHGVVFDASVTEKQSGLLHTVRSNPLDAILDPQTLALGFDGGRTKTVTQLSWAGNASHSPNGLDEGSRRDLVSKIVSEVDRHGFTGVIAPTHFILNADDPWLSVDGKLCAVLRSELDRRGRGDVSVIYLLAMPMAIFRQQNQRQRIIDSLPQFAFESLWLRIANFGHDATGPALEAYLDGAREFGRLGVPVVSDHLGGLIGLSSVAFGAVGGICHGVAMHEGFDIYKWKNVGSSKGGGSEKRVYIPSLDIHLPKSDAKKLFAIKGAPARFGCRDTEIAPRGINDMLNHSGAYFIAQRIKQIHTISSAPESIRASEFVEHEIRPLTDRALWAARAPLTDADLTKRLEKNRTRLDRLRPIFGALSERSSNQAFAPAPPVRAVVRS